MPTVSNIIKALHLISQEKIRSVVKRREVLAAILACPIKTEIMCALVTEKERSGIHGNTLVAKNMRTLRENPPPHEEPIMTPAEFVASMKSGAVFSYVSDYEDRMFLYEIMFENPNLYVGAALFRDAIPDTFYKYYMPQLIPDFRLYRAYKVVDAPSDFEFDPKVHVAQPKYNGHRGILVFYKNCAVLVTRRGTTKKFSLDVVANRFIMERFEGEPQGKPMAALDGERIAADLSMVYPATNAPLVGIEVPGFFVAFDLIWEKSNPNIFLEDYWTRRERLKKIVKFFNKSNKKAKDSRFPAVPTNNTLKSSQFLWVCDHTVSRTEIAEWQSKCEGVVMKNADGHYIGVSPDVRGAYRAYVDFSPEWWRIKEFPTFTVECTGGKWSARAGPGVLGSLIIQCRDVNGAIVPLGGVAALSQEDRDYVMALVHSENDTGISLESSIYLEITAEVLREPFGLRSPNVVAIRSLENDQFSVSTYEDF